jgi:hypothetical protein
MDYNDFLEIRECIEKQDPQRWKAYKESKERTGNTIDLTYAKFELFKASNFDLSQVDLRYSENTEMDVFGADVKSAKIYSSIQRMAIVYAVMTSLSLGVWYMANRFFLDGSFLQISVTLLPSFLLCFLLKFKVGFDWKNTITLLILHSILFGFVHQTKNIFIVSLLFSFFLTFTPFIIGIWERASVAVAGLGCSLNLGFFVFEVLKKQDFFILETIFLAFSLLVIIAAIRNTDIENFYINRKFQFALNPELAIGYKPPKEVTEAFEEQERIVKQKKQELFKLENDQDLKRKQEEIEHLEEIITKQKSLYSTINEVITIFEKPNKYIDTNIRFTWGQIVFFIFVGLCALITIVRLEYNIYSKYWSTEQPQQTVTQVNKATPQLPAKETVKEEKETPFWSYSPVIFASLILGFSVTQVNKRFKEINQLHEKKRFLEGLKSTLLAYNRIHDPEETNEQIKKVIKKLEQYYFQQLKIANDPDKEDPGSSTLADAAVDFLKSSWKT